MKLFRISNYAKNAFIFAPLFFGFQFQKENLFLASIGFVCFSLLASSVYILNDIFDLKADQQHPTKKFRPLASGVIKTRTAAQFGIFFALMSLILISLVNTQCFYIFISYFGINISYTFWLKKIPVVDVFIIASGFIIRILIGSFLTDVPLSIWIYIMTLLLSLFLGFSKRWADVKLAGENNLKGNISIYSFKGIQRIVYALGILICLVYICYTLFSDVSVRLDSNIVYLTSGWVILGIYRYLYVLKSNTTYKDPTKIIVQDWVLQLIFVTWMLSFVLIKYL